MNNANLTLSNFDALVKKQKKEENVSNDDPIVEYRRRLYQIIDKALLVGEQKSWKYRFVKNAEKRYNKPVNYLQLINMEKGDKNTTSRMYIMLLLEIERAYNIDILKELDDLLSSLKK